MERKLVPPLVPPITPEHNQLVLLIILGSTSRPTVINLID